MNKTHAGKLLLAAVAVGSLLAACSDSKKDTTATTAAPATTGGATTAPATTGATATTAADTGTTLSAADLLTTVQASFDKVFAGASMDPAYQENADAHKASMDASRADPQAKDVTVAVKSAEYQTDAQCGDAGVTAPCVAVVWDLVYQGAVVIPDNHGFAIYQDGVWKVSDPTYCSVATLGNHNLDC